jgi:hypothetical protein
VAECCGSPQVAARQVFEALLARCEAKNWTKPILTVAGELSFAASAVRSNVLGGMQTVDNAGNMPVHYVVRHAAASDVLKLMLRICDDLATGATRIDGHSFICRSGSKRVSSCSVAPSYFAVKDKAGRTALHLAAASGHTSHLRTLLSAAPAAVNGVDGDERTPLIYAVMVRPRCYSKAVFWRDGGHSVTAGRPFSGGPYRGSQTPT